MPKHLPLSLLFLRLGVFIVFFFWTLDKFVNPEHAAGVFSKFYALENLGASIVYVVGGLQIVLILLFVAGLFKKWTYGIILLLHASSTFATFGLYLHPFDNLLFFAAWPMLAACLALFLMRDYDTLTLGKNTSPV
ncbi:MULTISPECIES: hypothetical protein [unclassified Psychrobacter]|uniref:hypothetical protein n=1 Tax=unclassified Psychrobacter TaxID=196806 RepID=UPI0025B5391C|nr:MULTISPECIES: hypothetical protein [unclassified Psychrobacter]MDN3453971.1 hypothetical protein [Psychrobacter sp. APC 3350]MDN3503247.1 hypothetical protein [Psychrobacter sp. 5A.1]